MSKYLSNAAIQEFDAEVKHQYQGTKSLRSAVTLRTGVKGDAYKFGRMGKGVANQKATQADVTPMNIAHARQTATMENWNAPEYTDIFDQAEVNFEEQQELAQTIAKAIGRREDQLIIDAMTACTFHASTVDPDIARVFDISGTRNMDFAALSSTLGHFQDLEIDDELHIAMKAGALQELLSISTVSSADYNTVKALVNGELDTYMGMKWHVIGTRAEGGLPGVTTDEIAYAWAKSSIGLAINMDLMTTVDWVPQKTSWLANGLFKAGAVAREPQGIVKIQYDETA